MSKSNHLEPTLTAHLWDREYYKLQIMSEEVNKWPNSEKPVQNRGKESRPKCRNTDTITPKKRMSPSKWEWDMVGMRHGRLEHWLFDKSKRRSLKVFKNRGGNLGKAPRLGRGGNLERAAFRYLVMKKNNQELEITSTSKTRGSQNQKIYHHPPKGGSFF